MVTLTVGLNSYGTLSEADLYLANSLRASATWGAADPDKKKRALISATRWIERQYLLGEPAGYLVTATAAISAAGTGYSANAIASVVGGTGDADADVTILTAPGGIPATLELLDAGLYTVFPTPNPLPTSASAGTGLTLDLTSLSQVLHFPASGLVNRYGDALDATTYPTDVKLAEFELAYELLKNPSLETSIGTGNEKKRLKAGSAEIEYFRPTIGTRFPSIIQELLGPFLAGAGTLGAPFVSGTDVVSAFAGENFGRLEGL
jgi:hypothetical protein